MKPLPVRTKFQDGVRKFLIALPSTPEELYIETNQQVTMMYMNNNEHVLRVSSRSGGVSFFFDGVKYREIFCDGVGRVEDSSKENKAVWKQCKQEIDKILDRLGLEQSRRGWLRFFDDLLPWESCGVHVQKLRPLYDSGVTLC